MPVPSYNVPVLTVAHTIKCVMSSAAEAKVGELYICAKEMVPLRQSLIKMGWPQPQSPIQCNNSTAVGATNQTTIPHKTKSMDIQFHWLCCRNSKCQFCYFWAPDATNIGNCSTKNHPPPITLLSATSAKFQTTSQYTACAWQRWQLNFSCFTKFTARVCRSPGYLPGGVPLFPVYYCAHS